jgi:hypothetical protein
MLGLTRPLWDDNCEKANVLWDKMIDHIFVDCISHLNDITILHSIVENEVYEHPA